LPGATTGIWTIPAGVDYLKMTRISRILLSFFNINLAGRSFSTSDSCDFSFFALFRKY
jgi:hypothetical protein